MLLAGSSVRITTQLIRADTDEHLWAESYQRELRDVLVLQSEVAQTIAQEIKKVLFDEVYRSESRRVLATLIRLLGDFDLAEEAMQEAFAAALEQWPREGVPPNPRAWLVSTGRFKGIDAIRRRARLDASLSDVARRLEWVVGANAARDDQDIEDDRLRLIFTCCHPALPQSTQVALTLREVCGLTTEEIARALLTSPSTVAQRIVRGKAKIRDAGIPYQVPSVADLQERLASVLQVTYLVFNEGYAASSGASLTRHDLSNEAIRLGRLIVELLPDCEALGLLALMLLQESRRNARTSSTGDIILLEDQDRSLWNQAQIREGKSQLERALAMAPVGPYTIQAAIAAVHADAANAGRHGLASDRRAVRRAAANRAVARRGIEPSGRRRHARRSRSGARPDRRHPGQWRSGRLPPGSRGPCRFVPSAGKNGRCPRILRTGIGFGKTGTGTPLPSQTPSGTEVKRFVHSVELRTSRTTIE